MELLTLVDQAVELEERMDEALDKAYRSLEEAVLRIGKLKVFNLGRTINIEAEIQIRQRRVMGVMLPIVETRFHEHPPFYSPEGTTIWIDSALDGFKNALELVGNLAEQKISIMRLAAEVKKTIRKVNGLQKIAIPDLEETLHYVRARLEENERDMFVLMKMVKSRLEKRKEQGR
jgi:V/A-type H+-transporting ATPase subunit D